MNSAAKTIVAIVPAGGVGQRAGTKIPKQYKKINNIAMLRLTVMALLKDARVNQVIVGVAQDDPYIHDAISGLENVSYAYTGGASRADTVVNTIHYALQQNIISDDDWVMVHDAARPGLPKSNLSELINQCLHHNRGGILAMPAADTVKQAISYTPKIDDLADDSFGKNNNFKNTQSKDKSAVFLENNLQLIDKTLNRNQVWLAQTPQMFTAIDLLQAIQKANELGLEVTDESSAMEQIYNYNALLIKGSTLNLKVTWPEDFDLIANILKQS